MSVRVSVWVSECLSAKKKTSVQNGSNSQIWWTDISNSRIQAQRAWFLVIIYFDFCNFRSLKWICDFIVVQCSRPRQAHSKDLHSTIVAAFHCCKTWILHHPYLLQDKDCIATVLEVIELGISGTKSQAKTNEPVVMKDKKISQPASRRVKEGFCT